MKKIGIIDADLLDNGTRHPNLACMKISAYYKSKGWEVKLLENYENLHKYDLVSVSKVFSFTKVNSNIFKYGKCRDIEHPENSLKKNIIIGGTGFYNEKAPDLAPWIEHIFPDYHLYDEYIFNLIEKFVEEYKDKRIRQLKKNGNYDEKELMKELEKKRNYYRIKYSDYLDFSIGFATRGCFRKCSFCVNKKYDKVFKHSPISEFVDDSRYGIYLWDDNFMASPDFENILYELNSTGKPFQFRQGLDVRLMTDKKAELLSKSKYHGDYIFAFDHIEDKEVIQSKLSIWRKYCKKSTKLYVLTGYDSQDEKDIENTFERIKVLMEYGCLPYIMRYQDYLNSEYKDMYVQLARWCNQPNFFKKKSFREYCIANEEYHQKNKNSKKSHSSCYNAMINFENKHPNIAKKYYDLRFDQLNKFKDIK